MLGAYNPKNKLIGLESFRSLALLFFFLGPRPRKSHLSFSKRSNDKELLEENHYLRFYKILAHVLIATIKPSYLGTLSLHRLDKAANTSSLVKGIFKFLSLCLPTPDLSSLSLLIKVDCNLHKKTSTHFNS